MLFGSVLEYVKTKPTAMKKLIVSISLALVLVAGQSMAQNRPMHEIHAMMVYNFTKYIQWPETSGEFVIGIIGDDEIYQTLSSWYSGKVKGQRKFKIVQIKNASEIKSTDILYVAKTSSKDFDTIKAKVDDQKTLIITDKNGLGDRGSNINFKMVNNRLTFELNKASIEASYLKVSAQLMSMAI